MHPSLRRVTIGALPWVALAVASAPTSAQTGLAPRIIAGIDSLFLTYSHSGSPGCAVGVYQNGAVAFARGYGFANLTHDVPIGPATPFTVGSVSKQFTAASIALLVRAGRVGLDDDVRKYIPELTAYDPPVRVRHLVHHTSGMRDFWELVGLSGMRFDDGYGVDDMLALAARQQALNFTPGSAYRYSNTGYLTMAVLVQRVTGQTLRRFADSAMFRPLGMTQTLFLDDHTEVVPGRAAACSPNERGWRIDVWNNDLVGQGGIVTTIPDLQKWDENFYHGKVGGREFLELIQTTEPLTGGAPNPYAFGLVMESYRGRRVVQHTGGTGGYRSALYRFPELRTSLAVLCNASTANTTALALRMADLVLGDSLGPASARVASGATGSGMANGRPASPVRAAERAAIVGRYTSPELNDAVWEIVAGADSGTIEVRRPRNAPVALVASDTAYRYSADDISLRFDPPARGRAPGFVMNGNRVSNIRFRRVPP